MAEEITLATASDEPRAAPVGIENIDIRDVVAEGHNRGASTFEISDAVKRWRDLSVDYGKSNVAETNPTQYWSGTARTDAVVNDALTTLRLEEINKRINALGYTDPSEWKSFLERLDSANGNPNSAALSDQPAPSGATEKLVAADMQKLASNPAFTLDSNLSHGNTIEINGNTLARFSARDAGNGKVDALVRFDRPDLQREIEELAFARDQQPEGVGKDAIDGINKKIAEKQAEIDKSVQVVTLKDIDLPTRIKEQESKVAAAQKEAEQKAIYFKDAADVVDISGGGGSAGATIGAREAKLYADQDLQNQRAILEGLKSKNGRSFAINLDLQEELKKPEYADKVGDKNLWGDFVNGAARATISSGIAVERGRELLGIDGGNMGSLRQGLNDLSTAVPGSTQRTFEGGLLNQTTQGAANSLGSMAVTVLPTGALSRLATGTVEKMLAKGAVGELGQAAPASAMMPMSYGSEYARMLDQADSLQKTNPELANKLRGKADIAALMQAAIDFGTELIGGGHNPFLERAGFANYLRHAPGNIAKEGFEGVAAGGLERGVKQPITMDGTPQANQPVTQGMVAEFTTEAAAAGPLIATGAPFTGGSNNPQTPNAITAAGPSTPPPAPSSGAASQAAPNPGSTAGAAASPAPGGQTNTVPPPPNAPTPESFSHVPPPEPAPDGTPIVQTPEQIATNEKDSNILRDSATNGLLLLGGVGPEATEEKVTSNALALAASTKESPDSLAAQIDMMVDPSKPKSAVFIDEATPDAKDPIMAALEAAKVKNNSEADFGLVKVDGGMVLFDKAVHPDEAMVTQMANSGTLGQALGYGVASKPDVVSEENRAKMAAEEAQGLQGTDLQQKALAALTILLQSPGAVEKAAVVTDGTPEEVRRVKEALQKLANPHDTLVEVPAAQMPDVIAQREQHKADLTEALRRKQAAQEQRRVANGAAVPNAAQVTTPVAPEAAPVVPTTDAGSTPAAGASQPETQAPKQSGPGAAAASEYKESTAGKYWTEDFKRAANAEPLVYRKSPGAELEELASRFVKEGDLETITNDLLTKSSDELGFTEREYGYLVGSAMLEQEARIIEAESYGADDSIVEPIREKASALFAKYQDIYNRAGSTLQGAAHLEKSDPLMKLRAAFKNADEARAKKIEEASVKATGATPEELGKEIKKNTEDELKKQAETKTAEVEKTPAAKTVAQEIKEAVKKKVDAIRRKLSGKNDSLARQKAIKEAEEKLANFRTKLEKDGAESIAAAFFRDDPPSAKPGPLVQASDDLRTELSGLLNDALDELGIERVSEKRTPEEEYKRIVATLGLDDLRLGKMNEIDKIISEKIDKIARDDPDRADELLDRWEKVSAAMIDNGVSGSTMRRVVNLVMAERGVGLGPLSQMLPADRAEHIDAIADTIRDRVKSAGSPESAGTTEASLQNVRDTARSTLNEMLQDRAASQSSRKVVPVSATVKAQVEAAKLAIFHSDTPPPAPKAKPVDALRELIKKAIAEGLPQDFAKQVQDLGASEKAAVELENTVFHARNQSVKAAAAKAAQAFLDRFLPRKKRPTVDHVDKLVTLVMEGQGHGVLGTREFADAIAKTMGVESKRMNPAKIRELEKLAVEARNLPVGSTERMDLEQDIQDQLRIQAGLSATDLIRAGWYQNVLSALGTQAVNIKGDIAQMTGAIYQALGDALSGDPRAFGRLASAWARSFKPSVGGFVHTMKTGRAHKGGFKYGDTSASDLAAKGWDSLPASQKAIYHGMLQGVQRYGMRFMAGIDVMFNQMAREAGASLAAGRAVRKLGLKPGTTAFNVAFAKEMGLDGGKYLLAMQDAQKELTAAGKSVGLMEMQRRALEKINQSRSEENQAVSSRFADRSTYQFDPEGTGYYISALIDVMQSVPVVGRATQAFNRIVANFVYENLDYTGLGLIRGALGTPITEMGGYKKGSSFLLPKKKTVYDTGERRERALKGAVGIIFGASVYALAKGFKDRPDDETMPMMVYGYGPHDKKQRAVWLKAGNRSYSYRIRGRVVPYQESQMSYQFAIVGAFLDRMRYRGENDNSVSAMAALGDAARSIFSFGPLANVKKLADSIDDTEGGGVLGGIEDVAINAASGFVPFSSMLREIESVVSPTKTDTKGKELAGTEAKMMSGIPILSDYAPIALDVFGHPQVTEGLPGIRRIFGTSPATDDLTSWLLANKVFPSMPPILHDWALGEPIAKKDSSAKESTKLDPAHMEAAAFDLARVQELNFTPEEKTVFLKARGNFIEEKLRGVMAENNRGELTPEKQKELEKSLNGSSPKSISAQAKSAGMDAVLGLHVPPKPRAKTPHGKPHFGTMPLR